MLRRTFLQAAGTIPLLSELSIEGSHTQTSHHEADDAWDAISHEVASMNGGHLRTLEVRWGTLDPQIQSLYTRAFGERFRIAPGEMTREKWDEIFGIQNPIDESWDRTKAEMRTAAKLRELLKPDLMHQPFDVYES